MKRKSIGEYTVDWVEVALFVKRMNNWKCERCGRDHDPETGYTLTVHHLDMNPSNNAAWNLACLCQRCHLHIQGKVIMERPYMFEHTEWFKWHVAGYYAAQLGEPTNREYLEEHMDDLILRGTFGTTVRADKEVN